MPLRNPFPKTYDPINNLFLQHQNAHQVNADKQQRKLIGISKQDQKPRAAKGTNIAKEKSWPKSRFLFSQPYG